MNKSEFGKKGEELAAKFLKEQGFVIRVQNFRWARGEIDIIAQKDDVLVFIEVKTSRFPSKFDAPETWVNPRKQKQIGKTALKYLQENKIENLDCRFDVISVIYAFGNWYIKHIENAFWLA